MWVRYLRLWICSMQLELGTAGMRYSHVIGFSWVGHGFVADEVGSAKEINSKYPTDRSRQKFIDVFVGVAGDRSERARSHRACSQFAVQLSRAFPTPTGPRVGCFWGARTRTDQLKAVELAVGVNKTANWGPQLPTGHKSDHSRSFQPVRVQVAANKFTA